MNESQGQEATFENTTYNELTLLTIAGLIVRQKSPYPDTLLVALLNFAHTFDVEQIVLDVQRQMTHMIGKSIKEMVLKTSTECLPLLKGKIDELLNDIVKIGVNPSPLKSQIEKYMVGVDRLEVVRHVNSTKMSLEVQSKHLATIASQIVDALNFERVEARHHQSLRTNLVTLDTKQNTLKKELEQLGIQSE